MSLIEVDEPMRTHVFSPTVHCSIQNGFVPGKRATLPSPVSKLRHSATLDVHDVVTGFAKVDPYGPRENAATSATNAASVVIRIVPRTPPSSSVSNPMRTRYSYCSSSSCRSEKILLKTGISSRLSSWWRRECTSASSCNSGRPLSQLRAATVPKKHGVFLIVSYFSFCETRPFAAGA